MSKKFFCLPGQVQWEIGNGSILPVTSLGVAQGVLRVAVGDILLKRRCGFILTALGLHGDDLSTALDKEINFTVFIGVIAGFHIELAAKLRARNERREVEQVDLLVAQLIRHVALGDALGEALGDGRLADARLTDEAGVVLLAAVQDLHHPLNFFFPADDGIQLALPGPAGKVNAVVIQKLAFFLGLATLGLPTLAGLIPALLFRRGLAAAEKPV